MALKDHMRHPLPLPLRPPTEWELLQRRQCVAVTAAEYWSEHEAGWLWWIKWMRETGRMAS